MNKIYKVVWSRVKHTYVVASEQKAIPNLKPRAQGLAESLSWQLPWYAHYPHSAVRFPLTALMQVLLGKVSMWQCL